jgi:separase
MKAYPYLEVGFSQLAGTSALSTVFTGSSDSKTGGNSSSLKQLTAIIDRATYIGTCELLLHPSEVSLRGPLEACGLGADVVGAVLERQAESLEGSLWKDGGVREVVRTVLADALSVYICPVDVGIGAGMPVRRARVLIQSLRFAYRVGGATEEGFIRHPDDIGEEIEELLGRSVGISLR